MPGPPIVTNRTAQKRKEATAMAVMPDWSSEQAKIHPTAVIDPTAEIEPGAEIGPYCIVGKESRIGAGTVLHAHVVVEQNTTIGRDCQIFTGTILGGPPQDLKYKGEKSYVIIGNGNIIRECVTIHRSTGEGSVTRLGDENMIMAYAHIGHNCLIGSHITIASYVGISGHVTIEDYANFGGICGVHQHCRIGTLAMVGGMSGVSQDVPPYMLSRGIPARVFDVNVRGLRRAGVSAKVRSDLRQAYKLLYRSDLNGTQALEAIEEEIEMSPELNHLLEFIRGTRNGYGGRGNNPPPL
ncbi:MAG TPA: acyl-ACP--UDP-N-acetylglucosamine O-acyltransferase [Chthonomonadaceae bacterium]|nr:acyl-ACP--UDP-N-acetylglucosamine O-acyltransferase [Chthonomonadaceae bacterium]